MMLTQTPKEIQKTEPLEDRGELFGDYIGDIMALYRGFDFLDPPRGLGSHRKWAVGYPDNRKDIDLSMASTKIYGQSIMGILLRALYIGIWVVVKIMVLFWIPIIIIPF